MAPSDFYVYEHWRPDLNVPFYVGKGKNGRAKVMHGRGQRHMEIVSTLQQNGLAVEIKYACTGLFERAAFEAEMEIISRWRSQGIELINCTNGGDGTWGLKYTDDRREKVSKAHKGREWTPEHRANMSAAQKKRVLSPETWVKIKEALSRAHKGRVPSEESRLKMSLSQTGRKHSEATKQKMREKALEREACKRVLLLTIPKGEKMANVSA